MTASLAGGCTVVLEHPGPAPVRAGFFGSQLTVELPEGASPPAVAFAAEQELERRGYSVREAQSSVDAGRVVARSSDRRFFDRIEVTSRRREGLTYVTVRSSPADEAFTRDLVERMLTAMGL